MRIRPWQMNTDRKSGWNGRQVDQTNGRNYPDKLYPEYPSPMQLHTDTHN
jgi:hypothetical protein